MIKRIFRWIYFTNPHFWDLVISFAVIITLMAVITGVGYIVWALVHSWLLTIVAMGVPIFFLIWMRHVHVEHPKGIKGWWDERPWKKIERV